MRRPERRPSALPLTLPLRTALGLSAHARQHFVRHEERLLRRPAKVLLRTTYFILAERRAMRLFRAGLAGRAIADHRADADHRRSRVTLRRTNRVIDCVQIISIFDAQR